MRAHERRGFGRMEIQRIANERAVADGMPEFFRLLSSLQWERRYLRHHYKRHLYNFIGPIEFDGPTYTGQEFVGEIVSGRILNFVTRLDYHLIRGMHPVVFAERLAYCRRLLDHMRRCAPPNLPH